MARPIRIEYPGAVYHVVTRGNNRQRIFKDDHDRKTYLEKLSHYCELKEVELLCYCLLSNHVHLLLETPKGNLSKFMQPFQTSYTVYFNRRHHHTGHVFEQRYKAFLVDKDNYLLQVSRYIHLNPTGAGLASKPQDYRWSSYRGYLKEGEVKGLNRELVLEQLQSKGVKRVARYRAFVEDGLKEGGDWSWLPVMGQAFVGDERFVRQATKRAKTSPGQEARYDVGDIMAGVCKVTGLEGEVLGRAVKEQRVQGARELFMHLARRYSGASLREIARYLGARDISTVSHGVSRAERRIKEETAFGKQAERVLKICSRIQA